MLDEALVILALAIGALFGQREIDRRHREEGTVALRKAYQKVKAAREMTLNRLRPGEVWVFKEMNEVMDEFVELAIKH